MNYIFLDNGFEEIEAITTIDLLRRANIALTTVSVTGVESVLANGYLENATAMKVAGTAASQLKKNEDAVAYLEKYLQLSPNAKDAAQMNYTIAALAQTMGNKEKAKT